MFPCIVLNMIDLTITSGLVYRIHLFRNLDGGEDYEEPVAELGADVPDVEGELSGNDGGVRDDVVGVDCRGAVVDGVGN
ncbi:hypothetical protein M0R45_001572 [Rubus argutus]|uniref:Uncharacterized protein n=1 Tax=Rubus argutus TaxID=59490 RepID=A0AAW1VGY4_RUBAR